MNVFRDPYRLLDLLTELGIQFECRGVRLKLWPATDVSAELVEGNIANSVSTRLDILTLHDLRG